MLENKSELSQSQIPLPPSPPATLPRLGGAIWGGQIEAPHTATVQRGISYRVLCLKLPHFSSVWDFFLSINAVLAESKAKLIPGGHVEQFLLCALDSFLDHSWQRPTCDVRKQVERCSKVDWTMTESFPDLGLDGLKNQDLSRLSQHGNDTVITEKPPSAAFLFVAPGDKCAY